MRFFTNKQAPTLFQGKLIKNNIKLFIGLKKGNHKRGGRVADVCRGRCPSE